MKLPICFLALLLLQFVGAFKEVDTTILVTSTRTVTICPISVINLCDQDPFDPASEWSEWPEYPTPGPHGTDSSDWPGGLTTTSDGASTTSLISTSTSGSDFGRPTPTSTHSGSHITSSTSLVPTSGFDTTSSTVGANHTSTTSLTSTSTLGTNHTSTTGLTSTSTSGSDLGLPTSTSTHSGSDITSSTSTPVPTSGFDTTSSTVGTNGTSTTTTKSSTATSTSSTTTSGTTSPTPDSQCNSPEDRSKWCDDQSIDTDPHTPYVTGETKYFELVITNTTLDFDGTLRPSFAINGQSPGPVIEANWGDVVQIKVTNLLQDNATTIHWHGVRQFGTNDQDGVPGVTECGIAPGTSRVYTWHASSYGTGWYHSHALAQFGGGIRGPIIIHGPATANYDIDMGTVMVDDLFEATIFEMAYRTAHTGAVGTTNYLLNGKNKNSNLTVGEHQRWTLKPGKKHLFRFINSAAQNVWSIHFDGHKMKVIAADFVPIVPYTTEWLNIANGQRYDVIVEADQPVSAYFLRAVTQTACPSSCQNNGLGPANGILEYEGANGTFPTSNFGNKTAADFAICADEPIEKLVPHFKKSAGSLAEFQASVKTLPGGNGAPGPVGSSGVVFRWFLNNAVINVTYTQPTLKTLATIPGSSNSSFLSNAIELKTADKQWVYFVIQNQFFVSHPMHLHGHDFSLLGQGVGIFNESMVSTLNFENPIRRDTAMLFGSRAAPAGYTVIGFETDNPGAWVMHCHIIWHADGGMALQYIERPDAINAGQYWNTDAFQDECQALAAYEAEGPHRQKHEYEAGLRRRGYGDGFLRHGGGHVVRRSGAGLRAS